MDPSQTEPVQGLAGVQEFVALVTTAFPDARYTVEDLVAEGDRVVQRVAVRATHQGEFLGVLATGKPVNVCIIVISRIADGKIAEEGQLADTLSLLQQLGVIPTAEDGG